MRPAARQSFAALAMGALLACGGAAAAQQTLPAPSSPPMAEAPVDAGQLALARQLMGLLGNQMNFRAVWKTMTDQMLQTPGNPASHLDPAAMDRLRGALDQAEARVMPQLFDEVAKVYARYLTRQEMQDAIAFYQTPSGRSLLQKTPEMTAAMGPAIARLAPRIRSAILQALCANNACTPEQQRSIGTQVSS